MPRIKGQRSMEITARNEGSLLVFPFCYLLFLSFFLYFKCFMFLAIHSKVYDEHRSDDGGTSVRHTSHAF